MLWWYNVKKYLEAEQERWFLWVPVWFGLGISLYFLLPFEPSIWISMFVVEALIVLAYVFRHAPLKLGILGVISLIVLGFVNIQARAYHLSSVSGPEEENTLYLKGYVAETGYNYRGRAYLILDHMQDFDGNNIAGKYRITPLNSYEKINTGDCVEMAATVQPPLQPNLERGYQFNRKLYFDGIKATGFTDTSVYKITCKDIGVFPNKTLRLIDKLRNLVVDNIKNILPKEEVGIATAVIAGERGLIDLETVRRYRDSGLAHFLAISGLHMGMIAGMMFFVIRLLLALIPSVALRYDSKKIAAGSAIVMSFIYLVISGWQISTQRAFIMTTFVLIGVLFGRLAISMRMAAWAALIILILEPQVLISAGFQMSFAAVIMLIAFYEKYAGSMHGFIVHDKKQGVIVKLFKTVIVYLAGILVADFVASIATLPFAIYHFNRVAVYTSLANLSAGPIIGLWIMPCVLFTLLLMPLGLYEYPLRIAGQGIAWVNRITEYVSGIDNASYQVLSMPWWGLALIVGGGLWLALWQTKWRLWGFVVIVLGFLSVFTVKIPDVLVDEEAKLFAVKDNNGEIVILPGRGNYFSRQMWLEKLASTKPLPEQQETLRKIYKGEAHHSNWLDLKCDEDDCIYKEKVQLHKDGGILIDGKDYSQEGALSVYFNKNKIQIHRVKDSFGKRYWNSAF